MARRTFRLTHERIRLIEQFVRYRYLRMSHLYALHGARVTCTDRGVRRLVHDLFAHGFLHRRVAPRLRNRPLPSGEFAYWLSPKGASLAERIAATDGPLPLPRSSVARTLEHELAITDFHFAAGRACAERGRPLHWKQYRLRRGVNPDALFAVTDPSKADHENTAYYFLEMERARLGGYRGGQSVLLRRLKEYAAYQGSAECLRDWQWFDEFRVLIVVTSEARRRNLLALLESELPLPMFLIAVEGCDLSKPVLASPKGPRLLSLVD